MMDNKQLDLFEEKERNEALESLKTKIEENRKEYIAALITLPPEMFGEIYGRVLTLDNIIDEFGSKMFNIYIESYPESAFDGDTSYEYVRNNFLCNNCNTQLAFIMIWKRNMREIARFYDDGDVSSTPSSLNCVNIHCHICGEKIMMAAPEGWDIEKIIGVMSME